MQGISVLLLIVFVLFILQIFGGFLQAKAYQKAIHRVHKFGNVGFGQKKAGFRNGYLVMIACDSEGIITGGEIMKGFTSFARFKPWTQFLGRDVLGVSIYEYLDELNQFDKKKKKQYRGYIHALEALDQRLHPEEEAPTETDSKEKETAIS